MYGVGTRVSVEAFKTDCSICAGRKMKENNRNKPGDVNLRLATATAACTEVPKPQCECEMKHVYLSGLYYNLESWG